MDIGNTIEQIKEAGKFVEMYQVVATFVAYRENTQGKIKEVKIQIRDAGPGTSQRYHIIAVDEDGRSATGNPADTIETTIAIMHWQDLD